ncbi:MAG: pilus assembly protein [Thermoleophilia bacterium]|nr:pilus assembly protein [Thermoleophilia bacterium]
MQCGQATVEFVGTLPLLVLGGLIIVQALLVALSTIFAQSSASAAARQLASGTPKSQVQLPIAAGFRHGALISTHAGRIQVRLTVPKVIPLIDSSAMRVTASTGAVQP